MYCRECGKEINDKAVVCIHCGCAVKENNNASQNNQGNITIVKFKYDWWK